MATLSEEQLTDAVKQEAALRRVAVLVASGLSPSQVFDAVSAEAGAVLDAESAGILLVEGADLAEQAAETIRGAPLELIIDAVSGEPVAKLASLLRIGGPIVSYTARNRQPLSI